MCDKKNVVRHLVVAGNSANMLGTVKNKLKRQILSEMINVLVKPCSA